MRLCTIVVTRNKSIHVRTLHTLIQINQSCMQNGVEQEISFVVEDDIMSTLYNKIKTSDRLLFLGYSVHVDHISLTKLMSPFDGYQCLVCPAVKEGVNWEMFKNKILSKSTEPTEQMGLVFDTKLGIKRQDSLYTVRSTTPRVWSIDSKQVYKRLRSKKGEMSIPMNTNIFFEKLLNSNVKICAYTEAKITIVFAHQCLGNILNAAGVTQLNGESTI